MQARKRAQQRSPVSATVRAWRAALRLFSLSITAAPRSCCACDAPVREGERLLDREIELALDGDHVGALVELLAGDAEGRGSRLGLRGCVEFSQHRGPSFAFTRSRSSSRSSGPNRAVLR